MMRDVVIQLVPCGGISVVADAAPAVALVPRRPANLQIIDRSFKMHK